MEKVNLSCTNKRGDTVLHVAAKRGHIDLMLLLVQNGADDRKKNHLGQLPEVGQTRLAVRVFESKITGFLGHCPNNNRT